MRAEAAPRPRLSDLRPQRPGCPQVILTCTASRSPLLPLRQEVTQKPSLRGHHTGSWAGPSTSDAPRPAPPPSRRSLPLSPPLPAFLGPGVFLRHSVRSLSSRAKSEASGELCGARPHSRGPDGLEKTPAVPPGHVRLSPGAWTTVSQWAAYSSGSCLGTWAPHRP